MLAKSTHTKHLLEYVLTENCSLSQLETVTGFIDGLGFLRFIHMWYLSVFKLIKSMLLSPKLMARHAGCSLFCRVEQFLLYLWRGIDMATAYD